MGKTVPLGPVMLIVLEPPASSLVARTLEMEYVASALRVLGLTLTLTPGLALAPMV